MNFFSSDYHLGHDRIRSYCSRPFKNLEEMDSTIIKNHNNIVKKDDTLFYLGDFCLSKSSSAPNAPHKAFEHYRNQLNGNIIFIKGNHDCFSESTQLLTQTGYKKYNELEIGEIIPTLNLKTNKIEMQPIEKIIIKPVKQLYGFKSRSSEGEFSAGHELLINKGEINLSKLNLVKEKVRDLWKRKWLFNVPCATKSYNKELKNISDNELRLLGWIYTDGGVDKNCNGLFIYQSKIKNLDIIRNLLKNLNIAYKERIRYKKTYSICKKIIKSQLPSHVFYISAKIGKIIKNKLQLKTKYDTPKYLFTLSDRQFNVLLNEMIIGDGCINNGVKVLWGQKVFLEKIMGLCVTHNIDCNLVTTKTNSFYLCFHRASLHKTRQIQKQNRYIRKNNSLTWCVLVKNQTLFTSLNGKPLISGNCRGSNQARTIIESMVIHHGGERIFLVHDPKWARPDYRFNFTGHCHGTFGKFRLLTPKSVIVDLSVENWGFSPVSINDIMSEYTRWAKGKK